MTKTFAHHAIRAFALGAAIVAAPMAAQAALSLTVPTNALQANAVQAFSQDALDSFDIVGITLKPLGNASVVPNLPGAYNLPVTNISLQLVKIAGGSSTGSALEFNRLDDDTGKRTRVTLANFSIDFNAKKILADATQQGQAVVKKTPIFDFHEQTPVGLKYQFPLSITGKQVLDKLFLTLEGKKVFKAGLELPDIADLVLDTTDFGTITIDVAVKLRSKPVSNRPYVVAP
ncbi:hypothetical protein EV672_11184 [Aquabacterium commune]|uniref:DUF1439 domain-containing protein n=1 Tax=Aquabacterium commune TaxID=70586 RepID=A0A4V3CV15_9BURK|nr:hypothetical protein [Aquabacterium commune]TDP80748.1 hypothetical protein EV672_11184 [Aquabacterium commune]